MKNKKIPIFKSIVEEANFWDSHDVTDYLSDMKRVDVEFVPHTPKEDTIVIRVHSGIKRRLEQLAANQGLGLSTLIRTWFIEKIKQEAQRL